MRVFLSFALALSTALGLVTACGSKGGNSSGGMICDPGENIFCRCPGGEAGTKTCTADGAGFEACVTREGACPPIGSSTSSSSSSSTSSTSSSSGGGGGGMGGAGGAPPGSYLSPCAQDSDCESGLCPYGYCTKDCAKYDECTLGVGECISFGGKQVCMPVCIDSNDCVMAYGNPSTCGYTPAVDGTPVTTCADWLDKLKVPPNGVDCADDLACNLGNAGLQAVCSFGVCTKGCYAETDCPLNTMCSSNGATLGSCQ